MTKNKKQIKKEEPAALPKPTTPKLKPVAPSDFFGTSPLIRKEERKPSLKRKKVYQVSYLFCYDLCYMLIYLF